MESPDAVNDDFNLSTAALDDRPRAGRVHLAKVHGRRPAVPLRLATRRSSTTSSCACPTCARPASVLGFEATTSLDDDARRGHPVDRGGDRGRPALDMGVAAPDAPSGRVRPVDVFGIRILARLGPARLIAPVRAGLLGGRHRLAADELRPGPDATGRPRLRHVQLRGGGGAPARRSDLYALQAGDRPSPPTIRPSGRCRSCRRPRSRSWGAADAPAAAVRAVHELDRRPALTSRSASSSSSACDRRSSSRSWRRSWSSPSSPGPGNLYALLAPAFALTWWLSVRERTRESEWLVGAIIGAATVLKLGPAVLLVWLLAGRRTGALASAAVTALVSVAAAVWLGGGRHLRGRTSMWSSIPRARRPP